MRIRRSAHLKTRNVIGVVQGAKHPDDYIIYTGHWDHLGIKPDVAGPDKIYNGAVDNGMGVSSILEMGEAFAHDKPAPQRSIAIVCWTLEEQGLLGSEYFAKHPVWPLSHIVGGINIDANNPEGPAHDLALIGNGASEMEDILADALKMQGRVISGDPEPEKGHFYRSDHISLAKVGVPMLDPGGGLDLVKGGKEAGQAVRADYDKNHYHQPSDEFDPNWDLSGPIQDPSGALFVRREAGQQRPVAELAPGQRVPRDPGQEPGGEVRWPVDVAQGAGGFALPDFRRWIRLEPPCP